MTENFEDYQEKYRDKGSIKPPAVPLAADAAHLLSEYLDNLSIQLVRAGIDEPYRITQEYEEIFVQELQRLGTKNKLTYDITASMLERYGSPAQLVQKYILNENPVRHDLVGFNLRDKIADETPISFIIKGVIYTYLITILVSNLVLSVDLTVPRTRDSFFPDQFIVVLFAFAFLELITGIWGTGIDTKIYDILRNILRFFLTGNAILLSWMAFDIATQQAVFTYWVNILTAWLIMMGIGFAKDHTPYLKTSSTSTKPLARFILSSYIFAYLAIISGAMVLIFDDNLTQYFNDDSTILLLLTIFFATMSLLTEIRGKYPLSVNKLVFTILAFPQLFIYAFSYEYKVNNFYGNYSYSEYRILYIDDGIFTTLFFWALVVVITLPLIFRKQIKTQLGEYRLQLNEYEKKK